MTETKNNVGYWIKRPGKENMNTVRDPDWQQSSPVVNTGTDINANSRVYSKYIENAPPAKPVSNQEAPTTLAEKNRQKANTSTIQTTTG